MKVLLYSYVAGIAQLVEHFTRNEGVEGSSPFFSSMKTLYLQAFWNMEEEKAARKSGLLSINLFFGVN